MKVLLFTLILFTQTIWGQSGYPEGHCKLIENNDKTSDWRLVSRISKNKYTMLFTEDKNVFPPSCAHETKKKRCIKLILIKCKRAMTHHKTITKCRKWIEFSHFEKYTKTFNVPVYVPSKRCKKLMEGENR
jgi:hypothetical protein